MTLHFMQIIGSFILIFCAVNLTLFIIDQRFKQQMNMNVSVDLLNTVAFWFSLVVSLLIAIPFGMFVFKKLVDITNINEVQVATASLNRLKYLGSLIGAIVVAGSFVWVCHFILSYFFQPNLENELGPERYKEYLLSYFIFISCFLFAHFVFELGNWKMSSYYSGCIAFTGIISLLLPVNSDAGYVPFFMKALSPEPKYN